MGSICLCWVLPGLFDRELWKADEPYSFGIAYRILQTGDWVVPTVGGTPFMEKPPLFYVTAALFARLFSPWLPLHDGARVASGFFVLLAFLFAGLSGRRLWGPGNGTTTLALLLGSAGLLLNVHQLVTDTALFAGCSIAIYGLVTANERPIEGGAWLGLGVGVGFLSKGLLAPGVFSLASLLIPVFYPSWRSRSYALTLAVALAVALPFLTIWPAALYLRSPQLFRDWLWTNNFARFFGFARLGPKNDGSYFLLLLYFAFPASLLAVRALWRKARGASRERTSIAVPLVVFAVMWAVLESASDGRDLYALPLLLPLSLLAASAVPSLSPRASLVLNRLGVLVFLLAILALWVGWSALATGHPVTLASWFQGKHPAHVSSFRPVSFVVAALLSVSWVLLALRYSATSNAKHSVIQWAAGMSLTWGIAMAVLLPWLDAGTSYRSVLTSLTRAIPQGTHEIAGKSIGESYVALLDYYSGITVRAFDPKEQERYDFLLVIEKPLQGAGKVDAGWHKIWQGSRPGDTKEVICLYAKRGQPLQARR